MPNELVKLAQAAGWILSGLLMAAGAVHAQDSDATTRRVTDPTAPASTRGETLEKLLQDAGALIKRGQPAQAYALLEPFEYKHAGDVRLDYLIGIAALDSGKPDKASFAFERVLAVDPGHAAARLDMARAYYQLGDLQRARTEFQAALAQSPSDAARTSIQNYLRQIDARAEGQQTGFTAYVEMGLGRDNNVNVATGESQVQVFVSPNWINATLNPSSLKMADSYYALAAGAEVHHGLTAHWGLYAGADWRKRQLGELTQFDAVNTDVRAGITYEAMQNRLRLGVLGGQYSLGGSPYSGNTGLKGEWRHVLSPSNHLNVFAQSLRYRYADTSVQSNDFDQNTFGLGWLHVLEEGRSSLSGNVYRGAENDVSTLVSVATPNGGRIDGAKNFWGLRVGGQSALNGTTTLFATTGMQIGDYSKTNYYFLRQRQDHLLDLTMGLNWHWNKQWLLRPQLSYSANDSNIAVYGYNKMDVSLTVRRDFR